jgi:hypothetical protein
MYWQEGNYESRSASELAADRVSSNILAAARQCTRTLLISTTMFHPDSLSAIGTSRTTTPGSKRYPRHGMQRSRLAAFGDAPAVKDQVEIGRAIGA